MSDDELQELKTQFLVHEKECAERWKTAFNHFEKLDEDITSLNTWIKGGLTMVVISMFGIFITNLFL